MKKILVLFSILISTFTVAQNAPEIFTVDIYIDSNIQVYLENTPIDSNNIEKEMSDYAFQNNAFHKDCVLYRIYADHNLNLGIIMNVSNQLIKAFHPPNIKTERYLLDTKKLDVDASGWQESIQKLDLKAIEN